MSEKPVRVIPVPKFAKYSLLVVFVVAIGIAGAAIQYADHVDRKSDQRWCRLIVAFDTAYSDPKTPPQSDLGRQLAEEIKKLRSQFQC